MRTAAVARGFLVDRDNGSNYPTGCVCVCVSACV